MQLYEVARDRETDPEPAMFPPDGRVRLPKRLEQVGRELPVEPDPGVHDRHGNRIR